MTALNQIKDESENFSCDLISAGLWTFISDPFCDLRPNPLPTSKRHFHLLHPACKNNYYQHSVLKLSCLLRWFLIYMIAHINVLICTFKTQCTKKCIGVVMETRGLARFLCFHLACFLDWRSSLAWNPHVLVEESFSHRNPFFSKEVII